MNLARLLPLADRGTGSICPACGESGELDQNKRARDRSEDRVGLGFRWWWWVLETGAGAVITGPAGHAGVSSLMGSARPGCSGDAPNGRG